MDAYNILLFYKYKPIATPEAVRDAQRILCEQLGLRGRMLIAEEGINATLSGREEATEAYIEAVCRGRPELGPRFSSSDFKKDSCQGHLFPRLQIRVRKEIVRADLPSPNLIPQSPYLRPEETRDLLEQQPKDWLLLDVRDDYEYCLGYFRDAKRLPIRYFRQFKKVAPYLLSPFKKKHILTYCTGGIRCEKAASFLLSQGFSKVYQMKGGIIAYSQQTDGAFFEGSCYVFDARLRRVVNRLSPTVVGKCYRCRRPTERIINCTQLLCHKHILLCEACGEKYTDTCSSYCERKMALLQKERA